MIRFIMGSFFSRYWKNSPERDDAMLEGYIDGYNQGYDDAKRGVPYLQWEIDEHNRQSEPPAGKA